jgi:superfamily II DNA or RNA helicase
VPRLFNPDDLLLCFGATAFQRGTAYYREGRVSNLEFLPSGRELLVIAGDVRGSGVKSYRVLVDWDGETFEGQCSCPVQFSCKHAVALLWAFLARQQASPTPKPRQQAAKPPRPERGWREAVQALEEPVVSGLSGATPLTIRLKPGPLRPDGRHPLHVALYVGEDRLPGSRWTGAIVNALPGVKLVAQAIRSIAGSPALGEDWTTVPEHLVDAALNLLAAANCVRDEAGRRLAIRAEEPLRLVLEYRREGEWGILVPVAAGIPGGSAEPRALAGLRAWVWLGEELRPLRADTAALGGRLDPITIPPEERPEFERRHLPDLALAGHVTGPDLPTRPGPRGKPVPQLVLEEVGGKLRGRVGFLYGGVRVEADEPVAHVGPPTGPWYTRARQAERKHLARLALPTTAPAWMRPAPSATLELRGEDALDFLLEDVPRLIALGVEVLGEDRLAGLRVSRSTPSTSFRISSGIDWLAVEGGVDVDGESVPWPALWDALARNQRYVRLGSGRHARLPAAWLAAQRPLLEALGVKGEQLGRQGGVRVARCQAPLLAELAARADRVEADQAWQAFSEKLRTFGGIEPVPLAPGFEGTLRPYQHQGLNFLSFLRDHGLSGILADDMGLGKTVQAAALLLANHQGGQAAPSLVVAPTSLVLNWQAELARFAPSLRTLVQHGPGRDVAAIDGHDVVITTYTTARLDLAAHQARAYHTLLLDEAQAIKNPQSQTAQAVRTIKAQHRLCLTGTPVENHLVELWSQFAFLMPGLLGPEKAFRTEYAAPIAAGDRDALALLKARTAPFILRRLKADVAQDLPPRTDIVVWCELPPAQRRLYETVLAASRTRVMAAVEASGVARSQITILDALLKLRQVCCHPALLGAPEALHLPSAKLDRCLELAHELIEGGHRALVFSQFTSLLAHLRERLDAQGIVYEYLDGQTRDRQARVDRFNQGTAPLFLISLKAGGTGLNLVGADYVIHYDPWWNPAVEDQATDRAHRIGQTRQVFNYKLIARDTIEEKLLQLQAQKRALVRDVLAVDVEGKALTLADLRFLFGAAR